MKTKLVKTIILSLSSLLMASAGYAKCYPGLDCEADLPGVKKHPLDKSWLIMEGFLVKEGIAKDPDSRLMWMRCSIGQTWDGASCQGVAKEYEWNQAISLSKNFNYSGYNDWRLPTKEELESLVYCSNGKRIQHKDGTSECDGDYATPVIMQSAFPKTPISWFWTSSPFIDKDDDYIWMVSFYYGASGYDITSQKNPVRLVRNME